MYKDRIEYIDTLKGLLIILVVIGHTKINPDIQKWIYSFHMPLFFIISGFFYKIEARMINKKRVKRLLFPFLIYTIISIIFPGLPFLIFKSKAIEWENVFYLKEKIFFNVPIWFLIVLFFIEIKMNIIGRILNHKPQTTNHKPQTTNHKPQTTIMLLLIFLQLATIKYCPILPFGLRIGLASLSTFYMVFFLKVNIKYLSFSKEKSKFLCLILFIVSILLGYKFGRVDIYKMEFADNLIQYYILIIINLFLWIEISKKMVKIEFLKIMGKNTIYILGLHDYLIFFMRIIYKIFGISDIFQERIRLYFIEAIIVVTIVYLFIRIKDYIFFE